MCAGSWVFKRLPKLKRVLGFDGMTLFLLRPKWQ